MPRKFDKRVLAVLMEWDYGDRARGPSAEKPWFLDNLRELAAEVEPFWYDAYLGDLPALRRALLDKAAAYKPDLIFFVPYTDQFDAATLDALKSGYTTCAWFGDDTWRFGAFSSKLAPHFSRVCTTDLFSVPAYRALGVEPVLTQWAAQPPAIMKPPPGPGEDYRCDVSFVGARNEVRAWFIDRLAAAGVQVRCYGAGWPAGRVSFDEMQEIFRGSRINLNLSNSVSRDIRFVLGGPRNFLRWLISGKTAEQIKARNFEIPLAGGFQLTSYAPGLELYFDLGREAAVFTSPEDCAAQVRRYLADETARLAVARAGCDRARREHTYLRRLEAVLGAIWP